MLIGLCGVAGAGKDTVADFLVKNHGFVKVALADPIKRAAADWFDFSVNQLWGPSEERNKPDARYPRQRQHMNFEKGGVPPGRPDLGPLPLLEECTECLTPRKALQFMGTEVARELYPDVWVRYALRVAKLLSMSGVLRSLHYGYTAKDGLFSSNVPLGPKLEGVVIPDVRFLNEVDAVRAGGGVVWRVERPGAGLQGAAAMHQSEQEQSSIDTGKFSAVLNNQNGPLEELEKLVALELGATQFIYPDQK